MAPTRTTRRNQSRPRNPSAKVSKVTSLQSPSKSKSSSSASLPSEVEYVVERVLKACFKTYKGKPVWMYLVKWEGYDDTENTWEPAESFTGDTIERFWEGADTSGRKHDDPNLSTEGEEVYQVGPDVVKQKKQERPANKLVESQPVSPVEPLPMKENKPSSIQPAAPLPAVENETSTSSANEPISISWSYSPMAPEPEHPWLSTSSYRRQEHFKAEVMDSDGRRRLIADIYPLDRLKHKGRFGEFVENVMMSKKDGIADLFDDDGHLNKWLIDSDFYRGSGCWGREMDEGFMAYLSLMINPENDHDRLFQRLFALEQMNAFDFVISRPYSEYKGKFEELGFRRLGRTSFLVRSSNPHHPSWNLSADKDVEYIPSDFDVPHNTPVTFAILCIKEVSQMESIIRDCYALDPQCINQIYDGFAPISVAVGHRNLPALRILIELGVNRATILLPVEDHSARRKIAPLMLVRQNIDALQQMKNYPNRDNEIEQHHQMRLLLLRALGCTCGECTDGWWSSTMRTYLKGAVQVIMNKMQAKLDSFPAVPREPLTRDQVQLDPYLKYFPAYVPIFKTFYTGYHAIFIVISWILEHLQRHVGLNGIPFPRVIRSELLNIHYHLEGAVTHFFQKGGIIHNALDCMIDVASKMFAEGELSEIDSAALKCANDSDFALVRLGLFNSV